MPDIPDDTTLSQSAAQLSFTSIGPYRLIQMLGEGGMGEVWRAEQTEPLHRTVALKLIKAGMDTKAVVARFDSERQALALMDHPNIAKVFDAGATPEGRPFFVMEYVPGLAITDYCDKRRLAIKERLRLFMQVCGGVQHAHQKAIIHRDLKPSNVLVEEVDDKPVPKIIDFGLAKATGQRLTAMTLFTEVGVTLGTPDYMSPEQADRNERNIDTRTDVYSLGVILYELLVGTLPFGPQELHGAGTHATLQKIRDEEPTLPSVKVKSPGESSKDSAAKRQEEPKSLQRHLRGELDWITMKALEKDRTRRYGSPSDLAADIQRYLQNQPVLAGPPSASYRAQKYVRRHPVGVTVAAGLVLLLAGFAVTQSFQLRRITRERDRANRVTGFMEGMFKVSDPSEARGNSITAREILDKASNDVDIGLAQDPELQAQMMHVMGNVYKGLGLFPRAQSLFQRSADIQRRVLGSENAETLRSLDDLGWILNQLGHAAEAEKLQRETVATRRRVFGEENLDTLKSMSSLAWTLDREGNYAEAEGLDRKVLEIRRRLVRTEDRDTLATMNNLAATLGHEGHYAEAERLKRAVLETRQHTIGPEHPDTMTSMNNLAATLQQEGRYVEAEKLQRETLNMQRRILGPEHPDTLRSMNNLANSLVHEDHLAEALQLQQEVLSIKHRVLGPEHQDTLWAMRELAATLQAENQYSQAEKLQRQTLEIQRRVLGPERPNTLSTMSDLADTLSREGRYSEAEDLQRQTVDAMRRVLGPQHPYTLETIDGLAQTLDREGHYQEAEKLARETLETERRVLGPQHPQTAGTTYDLGCILAHSGRTNEAFSVLRDAVDHGLDAATDRAMATTPDLRSLRKDPRFATLVAYAQQHAATEKPN